MRKVEPELLSSSKHNGHSCATASVSFERAVYSMGRFQVITHFCTAFPGKIFQSIFSAQYSSRSPTLKCTSHRSSAAVLCSFATFFMASAAAEPVQPQQVPTPAPPQQQQQPQQEEDTSPDRWEVNKPVERRSQILTEEYNDCWGRFWTWVSCGGPAARMRQLYVNGRLSRCEDRKGMFLQASRRSQSDSSQLLQRLSAPVRVGEAQPQQ